MDKIYCHLFYIIQIYIIFYIYIIFTNIMIVDIISKIHLNNLINLNNHIDNSLLCIFYHFHIKLSIQMIIYNLVLNFFNILNIGSFFFPPYTFKFFFLFWFYSKLHSILKKWFFFCLYKFYRFTKFIILNLYFLFLMPFCILK